MLRGLGRRTLRIVYEEVSALGVNSPFASARGQVTSILLRPIVRSYAGGTGPAEEKVEKSQAFSPSR